MAISLLLEKGLGAWIVGASLYEHKAGRPTSQLATVAWALATAGLAPFRLFHGGMYVCTYIHMYIRTYVLVDCRSRPSIPLIIGRSVPVQYRGPLCICNFYTP